MSLENFLPAGVKLVKMGDENTPTVVEIEGVTFNLEAAQVAAIVSAFMGASAENTEKPAEKPAERKPFLPAKRTITPQQAFELAARWPNMTAKQRFTVIAEFGEEGGNIIMDTRASFFEDDKPRPMDLLGTINKGISNIEKVADLGVKAATTFAAIRFMMSGR